MQLLRQASGNTPDERLPGAPARRASAVRSGARHSTVCRPAATPRHPPISGTWQDDCDRGTCDPGDVTGDPQRLALDLQFYFEGMEACAATTPTTIGFGTLTVEPFTRAWRPARGLRPHRGRITERNVVHPQRRSPCRLDRDRSSSNSVAECRAEPKRSTSNQREIPGPAATEMPKRRRPRCVRASNQAV